MRDNSSYLLVFIGGFLLGSLLTGGVFGTYLVFGASRYSAAARMQAEQAMRDAAVARAMAEAQRMAAERTRQEAEARIRELEQVAKPNP